MIDKNKLRALAGLPLVTESVVTENATAVDPDLLGDRYPEGSSDWENAVATIAQHLKDAESILQAGAWQDWMQSSDDNFSGVRAGMRSKTIVAAVQESTRRLDELYDAMVQASEDF